MSLRGKLALLVVMIVGLIYAKPIRAQGTCNACTAAEEACEQVCIQEHLGATCFDTCIDNYVACTRNCA